MKRLLMLWIVGIVVIGAAAQEDPWASIRIFEGKWEGPITGKPGKQFSSREYRFELNGKFLSADEMEETFSLAPPSKDFDVYTVGHFRRVE